MVTCLGPEIKRRVSPAFYRLGWSVVLLVVLVLVPNNNTLAQSVSCDGRNPCGDVLDICIDGTCTCRWGTLMEDWSGLNPSMTRGKSVCDIIRGNMGSDGKATSGLVVFVRFLILIISAFVMIAASIGIVWGGYMYMTAGGSADRVQEGKRWIVAALLGITIALAAWVILYLVNPATV